MNNPNQSAASGLVSELCCGLFVAFCFRAMAENGKNSWYHFLLQIVNFTHQFGLFRLYFILFSFKITHHHLVSSFKGPANPERTSGSET